MSFLKINTDKCSKDGICVAECPGKLIVMQGEFPESVIDAETRCIQCGHCMAVCPNGAIEISNMEMNEFKQIQKNLIVSTEQTEQLILSRRSIRNYKDQKVDREILKKVIDIARFAPTGGNSQQIQWRIVDFREELNKLIEANINFMRILVEKNEPIAIKYRMDRLIKAWEKGIDGILRGAPALIITHAPKQYGLGMVDSSIALSYLDLAASSLGLGTCWAGFFMIAANQSTEIQQLLNLPEGNICLGALMIGYPKYKYRLIPPRKAAQIIWS